MKRNQMLSVISFVALIIGIVLLLSGCSTTTDLRGIQTGCEFDAKYKGTGTFKLTCDNELTKDTNSESQGTLSGGEVGQ